MKKESQLAKEHCIPCRKGTDPMKGMPLMEMMKQLGNGWKLVEEHHLEKEYQFSNFRDALIFTNRIGEVAELEGHHPDIALSWGKVKVTLWTHKINGLSENDFILAAKCDEEQRSMKVGNVCF